MENMKERLESLEWHELKRVAKDEFGFTPPPTFKKEMIIETLLGLDKKSAQVVTDLPKPGYAKIRIARGESPQRREDVQINVNGNAKTLWRGEVIEIPIKHYEALKNARNNIVVDDEKPINEAIHTGFKEDSDFEYTLISINPGPDPAPTALENQLQQMARRRRDVARKFGAPWMRDKAYKQVASAITIKGD